jgi:hypothetical protein
MSFGDSSDRPFRNLEAAHLQCGSVLGSASAPTADISIKKARKEKRKTQKMAKELFANQNLLGDQRVVINRRLLAGVKSQKAI